MRTLASLLEYAVRVGASDLHMVKGMTPLYRINGEIHQVGADPMTAQEITSALDPYLNALQRQNLDKDWEANFSFELSGLGRFRAAVYMRDDHPEASVRMTPTRILPAEELNLPPAVPELINRPNGLILVTGPSGSGKSTTLNYLVDCINRQRKSKILMIEDPIEYVHQSQKSVVVQLEVGRDTHSFQRALVHALRQDPDVIVVGELRSPETIATALTAAETGHLVMATLHTPGAVQAVERIVNAFQSELRPFVVAQLSSILEGVVYQQLLPRVDKPGRILAYEVMLATPAIRNLIREEKIHQLRAMIDMNRQAGMITMEQCIKDLYERGVVTYDTAMAKSREFTTVQKKQLYEMEALVDQVVSPPPKPAPKVPPSSTFEFYK